MARGGRTKAKSLITEEVFACLQRRDMNPAYDLLTKHGGLKKLVEAEKGIYRDHVRKHAFSEALRKPVLKGEGAIRGRIADQKVITFGTRDIYVFAQEVSTKSKRSKDVPGGSIDLLGYDIGSGRIVIIELKDDRSTETLLEALIQVSLYRSQLALIKERVLKLKDCPDDLKRKAKWAYGVMILAPSAWRPLRSELDQATKLLSREKRADAVWCVGGLVDRSGRYEVEMLIGPKSWKK